MSNALNMYHQYQSQHHLLAIIVLCIDFVTWLSKKIRMHLQSCSSVDNYFLDFYPNFVQDMQMLNFAICKPFKRTQNAKKCKLILFPDASWINFYILLSKKSHTSHQHHKKTIHENCRIVNCIFTDFPCSWVERSAISIHYRILFGKNKLRSYDFGL